MNIFNLSNSETNLKQCRLTQFQHILCRKGSGQSSRKLCYILDGYNCKSSVALPEPVGALPLVAESDCGGGVNGDGEPGDILPQE